MTVCKGMMIWRNHRAPSQIRKMQLKNIISIGIMESWPSIAFDKAIPWPGLKLPQYILSLLDDEYILGNSQSIKLCDKADPCIC